MDANNHHQDAQGNPNFPFSVGILYLSFRIKCRFLKFKTLLPFRVNFFILYLLLVLKRFLVLGFCNLDETAKGPFAMLTVLFRFQKMVFMLKILKFLKKFGVLDFLLLAEFSYIGSVFEFLLGFFIEFLQVPLLVLFLDGFVGIERSRIGGFRHCKVGIFIGLQGDGSVPIKRDDLVKAELITHINVYKQQDNIIVYKNAIKECFDGLKCKKSVQQCSVQCRQKKVQDNANKMKNFAIIEDLDLNYSEELSHKTREDILTDSFIRNFYLIKRYAHSDNQLFITKFKKKVIPKYLQQLENYCNTQTIKNRQLFYARRKSSNELGTFYKKNRQSLPELLKTSLFNQQTHTQSDEIIQPGEFQKSFPILFNEKPILKKNSPYHNLNKTQIGKLSPSQKVVCSPIFLNQPKKRIAQLQKISKQKLSKSYANIYADSLNFCQNVLFKNTFDQIGSKREMRDSIQGLNEVFNVKRNLADEKSIQIKMMNVLKKRKSTKTLKMKIFSKYLNSMNKPEVQPNEKENIYKLSFSEMNREQRQPYIKLKIAELALKGKLCAPLNNHRASTSCVVDHFSPPRQTFQSLDQIIDTPLAHCRKNILNITQSKLLLPKFS